MFLSLASTSVIQLFVNANTCRQVSATLQTVRDSSSFWVFCIVSGVVGSEDDTMSAPGCPVILLISIITVVALFNCFSVCLGRWGYFRLSYLPPSGMCTEIISQRAVKPQYNNSNDLLFYQWEIYAPVWSDLNICINSMNRIISLLYNWCLFSECR